MGKPLTTNQREISQLLLKDQKMKDKLMYNLRLHNNSVHVNFDLNSDVWISINNLKKDTSNTSIYDYFICFTLLLGDLCAKRNYKAIETLQSLIPYEICYNLVTNNMYPISIREVFCYLMMNLWLDVAPLQKVIVPNPVKFWNEEVFNNFKNKAIDFKRQQCEALKLEAIRFC